MFCLCFCRNFASHDISSSAQFPRDLKPENLLLKKKPKGPNDPIDVKIIDFGLSKAMIEPVARTFLGTRGYLAPEMLQRRDYDRSVDTWALGVIVFVLLCGCLPFDDDSATVPSDDVVRAKFVLRFPRWAKNLSASAKNLLENLLNVDPAQRYTAEEALQHPWVQGSTAPRANLLASPNRIRKSPNLRKSPLPPTTTTTAAAAAGNINVRKKQQPRGAAVCTTPDDSPKVAPIRQASL
jgi:serine/threonine protein kinase